MTGDGRGERVIEIDTAVDHVPAVRARPLPKSVPVLAALVIGVLIGMGIADVREHPTRLPAPAVTMHTVVVTEDGRSVTYSMPTGSVVSTPPVKGSCSITVDGRFVDVLSAVVGDAECGATVR